jgi:hypothetical protein
VLAVVNEFHIAAAVPALKQLMERLAKHPGPSLESFEWKKVNRILRDLDR